MNARVWLVASIVAGASASAAAAPHGGAPTTGLRFERNDGQTDPQAQFISRDPHVTLFLTDDALVMSLKSGRTITTSVRIAFVGADSGRRIEAMGNVTGTTSYFRGHDRSNWHTGVAGNESVRYAGIYEGVDAIVYGRGRHVEYDFVIAPHANPAAIRLHADGGIVSIDKAGDLLISTPSGTVTFSHPNIYQDDPRGRRRIDGRFVRLANHDLGFRVGRY